MKTDFADILIVGCGFSGSTFAYLAAKYGLNVHIIDKREHIGGNCYSYKDEISGVEVHKYGPHIFHTNSHYVWKFINKFSSFNHFINRVKARANGCIYSLPINLQTINQFFNKTFSPEEAKQFIDEVRIKNIQIKNFEDQIISSVGYELYEAFYKYYSIKQWGVDPKNIDALVAKRLPIRFNYNDNYYNDIYQGIPVSGYTAIFKKMLSNNKIKIFLNTKFSDFEDTWQRDYKYLIYTGPIDEYFKFCFGELPYRKVLFKELRAKDILGNAIINFTDLSVPFTRIHEHKWFTPEHNFSDSIGFEEYSESTSSRYKPFYPVRNAESNIIYKKYENLLSNEKNVIFLGRLAEFKYLNMDQVIESALNKFENFIKSIHGRTINIV